MALVIPPVQSVGKPYAGFTPAWKKCLPVRLNKKKSQQLADQTNKYIQHVNSSLSCESAPHQVQAKYFRISPLRRIAFALVFVFTLMRNTICCEFGAIQPCVICGRRTRHANRRQHGPIADSAGFRSQSACNKINDISCTMRRKLWPWAQERSVRNLASGFESHARRASFYQAGSVTLRGYRVPQDNERNP